MSRQRFLLVLGLILLGLPRANPIKVLPGLFPGPADAAHEMVGRGSRSYPIITRAHAQRARNQRKIGTMHFICRRSLTKKKGEDIWG